MKTALNNILTYIQTDWQTNIHVPSLKWDTNALRNDWINWGQFFITVSLQNIARHTETGRYSHCKRRKLETESFRVIFFFFFFLIRVGNSEWIISPYSGRWILFDVYRNVEILFLCLLYVSPDIRNTLCTWSKWNFYAIKSENCRAVQDNVCPPERAFPDKSMYLWKRFLGNVRWLTPTTRRACRWVSATLC